MFDYTATMLCLIQDIAQNSPHFGHLAPDSILVGLSQARTSRRFGLYAKVVPMRFEGGSRVWEKGRRGYEIEPLWHAGREILYLIYFVLPRFQNLDFEEKMTTVFHELYHIAPSFNGDIRRFPGAKYAHTCSKKGFDAQAREMGREYLRRTPNRHLSEFLNGNFKQLERRSGQVMGRRIALPKLKPVRPTAPAELNGQLMLAFCGEGHDRQV